jgi:tryptophan-rich sensory protein
MPPRLPVADERSVRSGLGLDALVLLTTLAFRHSRLAIGLLLLYLAWLLFATSLNAAIIVLNSGQRFALSCRLP